METPFRLSRKAVEKEARKQDILDAAARLFSHRDFHEVTVDQVAEEVGLSKGTLYLYFKNKDDLFHTIVVQKTQSLLRTLEEAVECTRPFGECLLEFARTHCLFYQENVVYFKITHSEMTRMSADSQYRVHAYVAQTFQAYLTILMELVKKGQREGVLRPGDPLSLVKALRGILHSYVFFYVFAQTDTPLSDHAEQIVDLFLHGAADRRAQQGRGIPVV
jgi:AcrR family transcriptional regulator